MKTQMILTAGLLALAACGGSEGGGNQAAAEGKQKPGAAAAGNLQMRPGQYEVTTEFLALEAPNMPPGMADMMKQQNQKSTNCVTEKEIREAQGGLFTGEEAKECTETSVKMEGGKMGGRLVCGKGDEATTMEVAGTYSADSYNVQTTMIAKGTKMRSRTTGRRVGECPADEAKEG